MPDHFKIMLDEKQTLRQHPNTVLKRQNLQFANRSLCIYCQSHFMRTLFFIAIVLLAIIPQGRSQMNTPIGERIWKREVASDTKAALLIAVTLRKGDDVSKHIGPFKEVIKVWWQKSDHGKQRDFLMTIIDEETRPDEIRKTVAKMISDDEELRLIFSRLGVATLMFGTSEGKETAEFSLKPVTASKL